MVALLKEEISLLGNTYNVKVYFVVSYSHVCKKELYGTCIYVDEGKESADLYIMNKAITKDVVVTQNLGLASMLVNRGVYVLSPRGKVYTEGEMNQRLFMRHVSAKERRKGFYRIGSKPFTEQDRQQFKNKLQENLSNLAGIR